MAIDLCGALRDLLPRYGCTALYVFGSRADEIAARLADADAALQTSSRPGSDVDVGVEPARGVRLTAEQRVLLTLELEDLFAVARVDLVVLPEASAPLAAEVVRGELLACSDPDAEAETQLYYLRRAGDLAPFYAEQYRELLGAAP
jgi:uncharacterized protein